MNDVTKDKSKKILIIVAIVFFVIVLALILIFLIPRNGYKAIEKEMIANAQEYIKNNEIKVDNQEYVFIKDLNIVNGAELCSKSSGVVVTNVEGNIEYNAYLKCIDYESELLDNSDDYIKLNGNAVVLLNLGTMYFDEGYTKVKNVDVEIIGEVPDEVGAYTINYVVKENGNQKTIVKRIVIVSESDPTIFVGELNQNGPTIILHGEQNIILKAKSPYEEPGFVAYDYKDGQITQKVTYQPKEFDTSVPGEYEIVYRVKNSKGQEYTISRMIKVVEEMSDLDIRAEVLNKGAVTNEAEIEVRVSGPGIKRIVLPDGNIEEYSIANYKVSKNGVYVFIIEDDYGNMFHKSVVVNNIDLEEPSGTCSVSRDGNEYVINVVANDNRGIKGIDYVINGNKTGFFASTIYRTKEKVSLVEAFIQDVAGNKARISCPLSDFNEEPEGTYTFKYNNNKSIIGCNSYGLNDKNNFDKKLATVISEAGIETRAGVVEAARFLVGGLNYRIPYTAPKNEAIDPDGILGIYEEVGLNIGNDKGWGCTVSGVVQGMDGINFIKWAFKNANLSFDSSLAGSKSVGSIVKKIKPGDIIYTPCTNCENGKNYEDIGIIIGVDSNKIYIAAALKDNYNSIVIEELNIKSLPKTGKFSMVKQYNYKSDGNLKMMWEQK